jgi:hypothetical protein
VADSLMISKCRRAAQLSFEDTMQIILQAPLVLIFRMWQQGFYFSFLLQCWTIHWLWKDVTMQPCNCWMCKTKTCLLSVHTHITHIEKAFVRSLIVCNQSYPHHWHSILCFYVLSIASRSFVTFQFQIICYPCYLSERWPGPITFLRFWPAIYGI